MLDRLRRFSSHPLESLHYRMMKAVHKIIPAASRVSINTASINSTEAEAAADAIERTERGNYIGTVHALENNYFLSNEEHAHCIRLVERIQKLYDESLDYIDRNGLDRALFLAGNEWAGLIQNSGLRFRTTYNDINYLRLTGPLFSGYHLTILDRFDVRRFPEPWDEAFVKTLEMNGIPTDIAEITRKLYNPEARLRPCVVEYLNHIRNVPQRFIVRTPRIFGEVGIEINGVLTNPDVVLCQSRINGMLCSGVIAKIDADIARKGYARVLEVGPGHGGLAYALKTIFEDRLEYICIDLPTSLYHSTLYLSTLSADSGCYVLLPNEPVPNHFKFLFIANYMIEEVAASLGPIDLALNTMSFPEMSAEQIHYYGELFKRLIGSDGIVFEENGVVRPWHVDIKEIFSRIFPYRKHVSSDIVTTKNWCQDIWSNNYIGSIHNCSDTMLLR